MAPGRRRTLPMAPINLSSSWIAATSPICGASVVLACRKTFMSASDKTPFILPMFSRVKSDMSASRNVSAFAVSCRIVGMRECTIPNAPPTPG